MRKRIAVIGASGFAREVKWLISDINGASEIYEFAGYIISDLSKIGEYDSRGEILGDYSWIEKNQRSLDCLAIGIGVPAHRLRVGDELSKSFPSLEWPALMHPSTQFDKGSSTIERGTLLCAGTIGTVNLRIEEFSMVNLSCTMGHEARIGRGCVLNPTVNVSGGVRIEEGVLVGTGAQILQYVTVRKEATVGAGAVVTKDVDPGVTVVGIPAKPLK